MKKIIRSFTAVLLTLAMVGAMSTEAAALALSVLSAIGAETPTLGDTPQLMADNPAADYTAAIEKPTATGKPTWSAALTSLTDEQKAAVESIYAAWNKHIDSEEALYFFALYSQTHNTAGVQVSLTTGITVTATCAFSADPNAEDQSAYPYAALAGLGEIPFCGIGSEENPFAGTMTAYSGSTVTLQENVPALFAWLSTDAKLESPANIVCENSAGGLTQVLVRGTSDAFSNAFTVSGSIQNSFEQNVGAYFGEIQGGEISLSIPLLNNNIPTVKNAAAGSVGGLIGKVNDGVTLALTLPGSASLAGTVTAAYGDAGGLIGEVAGVLNQTGLTAFSVSGAVQANAGSGGALYGRIAETGKVTLGDLTIGHSGSVTAVRNTIADAAQVGGNAGALVGSLEASGALTVANLTFSESLKLCAGFYAGGVVGKLGGEIAAGDISMTATKVEVGNLSTCAAGGLFGYTDQTSSFVYTKFTATALQVSGSGKLGGVVGEMKLGGAEKPVTIPAATDLTCQLETLSSSDFNDAAAGGFCGKVTSGGACLTVEGGAAAEVSFVGGNSSLQAGGAVGRFVRPGSEAGAPCLAMGDAANAVSLTINGVPDTTGALGAVLASLGNDSLLNCGKVSVAGSVSQAIAVVYNIERGGAIRFYGGENAIAYSGSLWVENTVESIAESLVFKENAWSISRNSTTQADEIGNTGRIINNGNDGCAGLIVWDDTAKTIGFDAPLAFSGNRIVITDAKDIAKLAITLTTRGYFSGVEGIGVAQGNTSYTALLARATTIALAQGLEIDLAPLGLEGLTRSDDTTDAFLGTWEGNNSTIKLGIGCNYGDATSGTYHVRLGLFSAINGATVKDTTVAGTLAMRYFNALTYMGGFASYARGAVSFSNVESAVAITAEHPNEIYQMRQVYIGGLIGLYENGNSLAFDHCTYSGSITVGESRDYAYSAYAGGLVARVNYNADGNLTIENTTLSGQITCLRTRQARVGGLIAFIPEDNKVSLTITDIATTEAFAVLSSATEFCGGQFGYQWLNVEAAIDATEGKTNTIAGSVTMQGAASFGGLVYEAAGKLTVANTTVSGKLTGNGAAFSGALVGTGTHLYMVVRAASVDVTPADGSNVKDLLIGRNFTAQENFIGDENGILTIETGAAIGVIDTTEYPGATYTSNTDTRYYYNIEKLDSANRSDSLTNTENLLLWQIRKDAYYHSTQPNPRYYFGNPTDYEADASGDDISLAGLCFYPVHSGGGSLDFNGKKVTFAYDDSYQAGQLALLQTGFFATADAGVTLREVTLTGMFGKNGDGSGVLISGRMTGGSANYLHNLTVHEVTLDGIAVAGSSTPLLINAVERCVEANIASLTQTDAQSAGSASSLIGRVGSASKTDSALLANADYLQFEFTNMALDGKTASSTFTQAIYMTSFWVSSDSTSSIIYDIHEEDVWVTYGYEIGSGDRTYWYSDTVISDNGTTDFTTGVYLHYVADINISDYLHINLVLTYFEGCGTKDHPYQIQTVEHWNTIYSIIALGTIPNGFKVYYNATDEVCPGGESHTCTLVEYGTSEWPSALTADWFAGAYYTIERSLDIALTSGYVGLGTATRPFKGSIVGNGASITITIHNNQTGVYSGLGFVNISKGCQIKNLTVKYETTADAPFSFASTNGVPAAYFGGVIGTVIGGDSVIDNVSLDYSASYMQLADKQTNYAGGYVGLISAGGVIFRHCNNGGANDFENSGALTLGSVSIHDEIASAYTGTTVSANYLYQNPAIGRILDGYAFSESGSLHNTDKNYTIPAVTLPTDADKITINGVSKATIANAQQLLVFSAALNAGALQTTTAYSGSSSWGIDNAASATPYLVAAYFSAATFVNGSGKSITITGDCDMSGYGNGFRGLGGKYTTPANNSANTANNTAPLYYNRLGNSTIDGKGHKITMAISVYQYSSDLFYAREVGFFNSFKVDVSGTIENLTLSGKVMLVSDAIPRQDDNPNYIWGYVGGLIGCTNISKTTNTLTIKSVKAEGLTVYGANFTGGLVGFGSCKMTLSDCTFSDLTLQGRNCVGGLIGCHYSDGSSGDLLVIGYTTDAVCKDLSITALPDYSGCKNKGVGGLVGWSGRCMTLNAETTDKPLTLSNISIRNDQSYGANYLSTWGGVAGTLCGVLINKINRVSLIDSSIISTGTNSAAGGFVGGLYKPSTNSDSSLVITDSSVINTTVQAVNYAGGLLGWNQMNYTDSSKLGRLTVSNFQANVTVSATGTTGYAGGILGNQKSKNGNEPAIHMTNVEVTGSVSGALSGALIGSFAGTFNAYSIWVHALAADNADADTTHYLINTMAGSAAAHVLAVHADAKTGTMTNVKTGATSANAVFVYANHTATTNGTNAITSASDVANNPQYAWASGSVWQGDGANAAALDSLGLAYLSCNGNAAFPVFAVDINSSVTVADQLKGYIAALTKNADYDQISGFAISFASQGYTLQADGSISAGNTPSVNENLAATGTYDSMDTNHTAGTFTVLTITIRSDLGDLILDLPLYYQQILEMITHIVPIGTEEYHIAAFINKTIQNTSIYRNGGTVTFYVEFLFSSVRANDDFAFDKSIQISNNIKWRGGTQVTLIDLNSAHYGQAYTKRYEEDFDAITWSDFDENFPYCALKDLPDAPPVDNQIIGLDEDWGVERYLVVLQLPTTEEEALQAVYNWNAGVTESNGVSIDHTANPTAQVTVWNNPTIVVETMQPSWNDKVFTAKVPISVIFANEYMAQVYTEGISRYGNLSYSFTKREGDVDTALALPLGATVSYVGNFDNLIVKDGSDANQYTYDIIIDFSAVSEENLKAFFGDGGNSTTVQMSVTYWLTEERNGAKEAGVTQTSKVPVNLQYSTDIPLTMNVLEYDSLGINKYRQEDGWIDIEVSADIGTPEAGYTYYLQFTLTNQDGVSFTIGEGEGEYNAYLRKTGETTFLNGTCPVTFEQDSGAFNMDFVVTPHASTNSIPSGSYTLSVVLMRRATAAESTTEEPIRVTAEDHIIYLISYITLS